MHPEFGVSVGEKRHRLLPYDLPSLLQHHAAAAGRIDSVSMNRVEVMRISPYAVRNQTGCGQVPEDWNPSKVDCCSVDVQHLDA